MTLVSYIERPGNHKYFSYLLLIFTKIPKKSTQLSINVQLLYVFMLAAWRVCDLHCCFTARRVLVQNPAWGLSVWRLHVFLHACVGFLQELHFFSGILFLHTIQKHVCHSYAFHYTMQYKTDWSAAHYKFVLDVVDHLCSFKKRWCSWLTAYCKLHCSKISTPR